MNKLEKFTSISCRSYIVLNRIRHSRMSKEAIIGYADRECERIEKLLKEAGLEVIKKTEAGDE